LEQFWIEIEAGPLGNAENARALWTKIEGKLKASSESWLARVALEKYVVLRLKVDNGDI